MVSRTTKKKIARREPTPSAVLKKITTLTDSNKTLQKEVRAISKMSTENQKILYTEIRGISKIFGENQKILISLKGMIDTLASTLEAIERQSKQINIIEDDTQKLYAGLNQLRARSGMVDRINSQTIQLQKEMDKISNESKSKILSRQVKTSADSVRNNSQMITKIVQRIEETREDIRAVSKKTDSLAGIVPAISKLKNSIDVLQDKGQDGTAKDLRDELERIAETSSNKVL